MAMPHPRACNPAGAGATASRSGTSVSMRRRESIVGMGMHWVRLIGTWREISAEILRPICADRRKITNACKGLWLGNQTLGSSVAPPALLEGGRDGIPPADGGFGAGRVGERRARRGPATRPHDGDQLDGDDQHRAAADAAAARPYLRPREQADGHPNAAAGESARGGRRRPPRPHAPPHSPPQYPPGYSR